MKQRDGARKRTEGSERRGKEECGRRETVKEDGVRRLEVDGFKNWRKEVAQRGNEKREREEMKIFRDKEKKGKKKGVETLEE